MSIDTQGLPPYQEQKTKKLKSKTIYNAPVNLINILQEKDNKNKTDLLKSKKR